MQLKLVLKTKFPPIFPTCFPQISRMGIFVKQLSLIFLLIPLIPQFTVQFAIQSHKCTLSLGIRPILCILHVSLKIRISHYARQRIINLGNSGEIQGNSGEIRRNAFHSFSLVFPGVKYISLLGKSHSPDFSSG